MAPSCASAERVARAATATAATRAAVSHGSRSLMAVTLWPVMPLPGLIPLSARTVAFARTRRPSVSRIITGESMASKVRRQSAAACASAASDSRRARVRSSMRASSPRR